MDSGALAPGLHRSHTLRPTYTITPEALLHLYKHHQHDLLKRGIANQSFFEAYVQYCYSPKHTVGEQLLDVRREGRERAAFTASGTFDDSMRPLQQTGQIRLVEVNGEEVLPGLCFLPTPCHSIDHAAIEIVSDGHVAIFGGDVMHHPLELYDIEFL